MWEFNGNIIKTYFKLILPYPTFHKIFSLNFNEQVNLASPQNNIFKLLGKLGNSINLFS